MKRMKLENGGIEGLIRNDGQYIREKVEENFDVISESLGVKDVEIFSFDGKNMVVATSGGDFIKFRPTINEDGSLELSDFALVEDCREDEFGRRAIIETLVENLLEGDNTAAEEAWEQLVEAYRPFIIKGKIGRRHVSRAYYKMRRKSRGKGIVRSRRTGAIIRRMTGRERQKRRYTYRRIAKRGSTKRNRRRSMRRRTAFRLRNVKFESVNFAASVLSQNMTKAVTEANIWLDSCFGNWCAEEPAIATIFESNDGDIDSILIESASGYNATKRDYDAFVIAKEAVMNGRRDARKMHRNIEFQETVAKIRSKSADVSVIAEELASSFPSVAYAGKKSLSAQFAYCIGRQKEKSPVPSGTIDKLASEVVDIAWEHNPSAVQHIALVAEGWLFPEDHQLSENILEAWRYVSENFDMALISEAKESKRIVADLHAACCDATASLEKMLPSKASMYPDEQETVLRGIHNVLQSHCATLNAFQANPASIDHDRLENIVDYLEDLAVEFGAKFATSAPADSGRKWLGVNYSPDMYDSFDIITIPQVGEDDGLEGDPIGKALGCIGAEFDTTHLVGDTLDDVLSEGMRKISAWNELTMEGYKISGSFSATISSDDTGTETEPEEETEEEPTEEPDTDSAEEPEGEISLIGDEDETASETPSEGETEDEEPII